MVSPDRKATRLLFTPAISPIRYCCSAISRHSGRCVRRFPSSKSGRATTNGRSVSCASTTGSRSVSRCATFRAFLQVPRFSSGWVRGKAMNDVNERIVEERVVVLAPTLTDAALSRSILTEAGITCQLCTDLCDLCEAVDAGAGAILLTEEVLGASDSQRLVESVQGQPDWSEVPVLLLSR